MANLIGWLGVVGVGAWAGFYCLKRAKGSVGAHWLGLIFTTCAGLLAIGTMVGGALLWFSGWIAGGALILGLVVGLPGGFDIFKDRKPDTMALLAGLILPSILAVLVSQAVQFGGIVADKFDGVKSDVTSSAR
jgi:hypothetical protein